MKVLVSSSGLGQCLAGLCALICLLAFWGGSVAAQAASASAPANVAEATSNGVLTEEFKAKLAQQAALEEDPHQLIRQTTDDLVALIAQARGYFDEDPDRFYREVQTLLEPVVDFRSFSRLVMAKHYKKASAEQRVRFSQTFQSNLVRTYGNALLQFTDEEIKVLDPTGPPRNPKRPSVNMEIKTKGGTVYPLSYTMGRNKAGAWQMKNIIINGINIGLTFRNQFASAVRDRQYGGDLDKVIDSWGELISEVDATGLGDS